MNMLPAYSNNRSQAHHINKHTNHHQPPAPVHRSRYQLSDGSTCPALLSVIAFFRGFDVMLLRTLQAEKKTKPTLTGLTTISMNIAFSILLLLAHAFDF